MAEDPKPQRQAPPLVFISYSRKDEKWRARLHTALKPHVDKGLITLWDDHGVTVGDVWSAKIEESISHASLAVLLVTPDYLASEWVTKREAPHLLELMRSKNLRLFPILLSPCPWEQVDWLRSIQLFPPDAKPLKSHTSSAQEKLLVGAAQQIAFLANQQTVPAESVPVPPPFRSTSDLINDLRDVPPPHRPTFDLTDDLTIDALSEFVLSNEARNILRRAQVLATFGKAVEPKVTSSCVLFGISEGGRDQMGNFETPEFFWRELQRTNSAGYQSIFHDRFPRAQFSSSDGTIALDRSDDLAQAMTENVLNLFRRANEISLATIQNVQDRLVKETRRSDLSRELPGHIGARHLLAALLVLEGTKAMGRLSRILDVGQLRDSFLKFVEKSYPDDYFEAWQEILGVPVSTTDEADTTTQTETEKDFRAPLAGFSADYWEGEDLLDITRDVNALASLAAATSIDPPLSIGLFGDWGSGKSHFMRQMRFRVEKLSQKARESGKPQSELGYHKRIVQIEFNAWHYIEGNLWASLVEHIFNNLKFTEEQDGQSHVKDARLAIMQKLDLNQELKKKIEERQQALQGKAEAAKQEFEKANVKRDDKWQDLTKLRQSKEAAVNELPSVMLSAQQAELLKQIGLPDGALNVPAEIQKKYREAKTFWGGIRGQWTVFRSDSKRLNKLIRILLVIAVTVVVGWFFRNVLKTAWGYAASAATFLAAAYAAAKPYTEKFNKSMAALKEKYEHVEQERQKKIMTLESEVTSLTNEMAAAETEAKAINAEVAKLEIELTTTDAAKLLANFIEDRAACSDYRRHLGVLALIRRDFEKLSELLSEQSSSNGSSAADEKTVSRIILYVDDLDRCPPKNVVQVLQAIHLLLAFPLFVVIVGVDARWVTRSLQESYEWLAADEAGEAPDQKKQLESDDNVVVTPHDYLEKIFQIPFWLKPMGDTECRNLLIGLTNNSRAANPQNGGDGQATIEPSAANATDVSSITNQADDQQSSASQTSGQLPQAQAQSQVTSAGPDIQSPEAVDRQPPTLDKSMPADQSAVELKAEEKIDLAPKSLTLSDVEIEYMTQLSPLIKRSPRAVKRFLNCYRLIKVNLKPTRLDAFIGSKEKPGQFTAVMVLLGMITGAPTISLPLIEELEKYSSGNKPIDLNTFLQQLEKNPDVVKHADWALVRDFLEEHILSNTEPTFESLIDITPQVSRYSFRVAKSRSMRRRPLITKRPKASGQAAV